MSYLEEFKVCLANNDLSKFQQLWEEYSNDDKVDVPEFKEILEAVKNSDLAKIFGQYVETALPLWRTITDPEGSFEILRLLIDLQTTNSPELAEIAYKALEDRYGSQPQFKDRLRMIGMRTKENFQGALSSYQLLSHMAKGKFVFHTGGWGTGEVVDISTVREQIVIEFELVGGRKDMSFENAFKTLNPLKDEHFLARRFGDPDRLEKEARENPVEIIHLLLKDLGPKSAAEIKDELAEWVIPEKDWTKWWQAARSKIKKDTMIETPDSLKKPFKLHHSEVTHEERYHKDIHDQKELSEVILTTYNYVRDFPHLLKKDEVKNSIINKLTGLLSEPDLTLPQEFQIYIFLEHQLNHKLSGKSIEEFLSRPEVQSRLTKIVDDIEIVAFKKRALVAIKQCSKDWADTFLSMLFILQQNQLRDYILTQLNTDETKGKLTEKIEELLVNPMLNPELFNWYFLKIVDDEDVPFKGKEGQCQFLEAFLILFDKLESRPDSRDLLKKMYLMLSGKRYALIRKIIDGSSHEFIQEFLLLVSKCQSFTDHDLKILRSLAEVAHPSLAVHKTNREKHDHNVLWTTEQGYIKTQERVRHIGTVEVVENAREIEAARAHGDLRENAEYKSALEKRSRLQRELKELSEQLGRARILTHEDVSNGEVSVGSVVKVLDRKGNVYTYTILGPWEANPDENILSFQSRLAQTMMGCKKGDQFQFREEDFVIDEITSYLNK